MSGSNKREITTNELLERGWTRTLIKRFLPRPDGCVPVNHWANFRGQDTYDSTKVWNIEQSEEFCTAFLKTWKGRNKGRIKGKLPEDVLTKIRKVPRPKLPKRTKEDVKGDSSPGELSTSGDAIENAMRRHPGLSREKAEAMAKAFGF